MTKTVEGTTGNENATGIMTEYLIDVIALRAHEEIDRQAGPSLTVTDEDTGSARDQGRTVQASGDEVHALRQASGVGMATPVHLSEDLEWLYHRNRSLFAANAAKQATVHRPRSRNPTTNQLDCSLRKRTQSLGPPLFSNITSHQRLESRPQKNNGACTSSRRKTSWILSTCINEASGYLVAIKWSPMFFSIIPASPNSMRWSNFATPLARTSTATSPAK